MQSLKQFFYVHVGQIMQNYSLVPRNYARELTFVLLKCPPPLPHPPPHHLFLRENIKINSIPNQEY